MIILEHLSKAYETRTGLHHVLRDVNVTIQPGDKVGILGRNGAGKSTLIRLISGAEVPTRGHVRRLMSLSWPLAFSGAFQGSLTGLDNLKFICRIYGVDFRTRVAFVEDFSELGKFMREPVKTYSSGMRARLAFALSMAIDFDCFLIDELIAVGDSRFQEKCRLELFEKRRDKGMIMVSHDTHMVSEHCTRACILQEGQLVEYPTVEQAVDAYQSLAHVPPQEHTALV